MNLILFSLFITASTNIPNGDITLTGDTNDGMPRSASYPSMLSIPDGVTDEAQTGTRPRTQTEPSTHYVDSDPHDRAHRTVSDPVTQISSANPPESVIQQQEPSSNSTARSTSPTTPTDTMSAPPITREQLSEATHLARPRSLADVQSIECLYSIEEVATPGSEGVNEEGAAGGEQSVNRPTHLKLAIPGQQAGSKSEPNTTTGAQSNCEISTQTSPAVITAQQERDVPSGSDSPQVTVTTDTDLHGIVAAGGQSDSISQGPDNSLVPDNGDEKSLQGDRTSQSPSRSPETRRRALSDIQLKQEIEKEVQKLRKRTISSGSTLDEVQSDGSDASSNTMQNPTQRTAHSKEGNNVVQSSVSAISGDSAASSSSARVNIQEGARQKVPSHRPLSRVTGGTSTKSSAGQRNNNNSLAQPGGGDRTAGEKRAQQSTSGDNVMDQQPESVAASSVSISESDSTPGSASGQTLSPPAAAAAGASSVTEGVEQVTSPGQASGGRDRHAENASRRDDAVWQRRRRVRSAAPSLRGIVCLFCFFFLSLNSFVWKADITLRCLFDW